MDALEYAEQVAAETLNEARAAYDLAHERVYKFLTLAVGGAGAAGVYGLGVLDKGDELKLALPLIFMSVWWFGVLAVLLLRGAVSNPMKAGTNSAGIFARNEQNLKGEAGNERAALIRTRKDQLASVDLQIDAYSKGATLRSNALDSAYRWLVCTPAPLFFGYLVAHRIQ